MSLHNTDHPSTSLRRKKAELFAESIIPDLWRFPSDRQQDILNMLPKPKRRSLTRKNLTFSCRVSQIEHDELMNSAEIYGMNSSQLFTLLLRSFKDHVLENHCPVPLPSNDEDVQPMRSESLIPEIAKGFDKMMKDLGLPIKSEMKKFILETMKAEEKLENA